MSKVFAQSVRDALLMVDGEKGIKAHKIPNHARQSLLRNDLVDIADGDEESMLVLTKVGRFAQEILLELNEAFEVCARMRESAVASVLTPMQMKGRSSAIPAHRSVGGRRPVSFAGKLNTDSFAAFLEALNAAGKNRWKDPRYQGEGPARSAQPQAQKE